MEEDRKINFPLGSTVPHEEWDHFSAEQQKTIDRWFYECSKQQSEHREKELEATANEYQISYFFALIPLSVAYANSVTGGELSFPWIISFVSAWILYGLIVGVFSSVYRHLNLSKRDKSGQAFCIAAYILGAIFVSLMVIYYVTGM